MPQRAQGERRVADILEAAAETIAEAGYEAATMTEISERAGTSIGAVYQYFKNKESVARALRAMYNDELDARWTRLISQADGLNTQELVDLLFVILIDFIRARPAYVPLMNAPFKFKRDQAAKTLKLARFAAVFQRRNPQLTEREALRIAYVTMEIFKATSPIGINAEPKEQAPILKEFKRVLTAYLVARLDTEARG